MNQSMIVELESSRKKLEYYTHLKAKTADSKKPSPADKWIEIYSSRVQKLERQVTKLGLRTQLGAAPAAVKSARA